jgi:hypothetical protein
LELLLLNLALDTQKFVKALLLFFKEFNFGFKSIPDQERVLNDILDLNPVFRVWVEQLFDKILNTRRHVLRELKLSFSDLEKGILN